MKITYLIGANAYICIEENGRKTDIKLSPGMSPRQSLLRYADETRYRADKLLALADLAERAAEKTLEKGES